MTSDTPNAMAAESAIRQIGTEFRRLRGLRGERIEDIATYLDIKATYLFGIEQGDLSVIPTKREAKSLVRSYANYLGLDGESITGPMDPIIASLKGDRAPAEPVEAGWFDRTSAIILGTAVVLGVLVGWSWIGDVDQFDLITPPVTAGDVGEDAANDQALLEPEESAAEGQGLEQAAAPADEEAAPGETAEALLAELKTAIADDAGTSGGDAAAAKALAALAAEPEKAEDPANVLAALVAKRGDGAHIYEAENTDARVIVRALSEVSVQVVSRSRDYVWTQTMKPKEMMLVPNRDDLELWTGDAGAIEVLLDGMILPQFGPPGTVVSGLSLAASSLQAIAEVVPEAGAKPTF